MLKPYYKDDAVSIYLGDCKQLIPLLERVDLILSDPPYGIQSWSANSTGGFMSVEEARLIAKWDKPVDPEFLINLARLAPCILWGGNYHALPPSPRILVWDKNQQGMHFSEVEIAWTNLAGTSRILNCPIKSQEIFGVGSIREHPTQKPLRLMTWCISLVQNADIILDPFMGSGTTLRAAKDLGRKAIGIEIEERYCEIAAKRMAQEVFSFD